MQAVAVPYHDLDERRRRLGISYRRLAELSGVSQPTVQRLLAGKIAAPAMNSVISIAHALGVDRLSIGPDGSIRFDASRSVQELREQQARKKARSLVGMVQGTSALEGQAVGPTVYQELVERAYHRLLAGPRRNLWED